MNQTFLQDKLPIAKNLCVLPELYEWFSKKQIHITDVVDDAEDDSGIWCYCEQPKGGEMICCENKTCSITCKWFHLDCMSGNVKGT